MNFLESLKLLMNQIDMNLPKKNEENYKKQNIILSLDVIQIVVKQLIYKNNKI